MEKDISDIDGCVQEYFNSLKDVKTLSKEKEHELLKKYREEGDLDARNQLISSNLKYASKMASSFRGRGVMYYELISEANQGLIEAIERFDINSDVKLISYAKWYIMRHIQVAIEHRKRMPYSDLPNDNTSQLYEDEDGLSYKDNNSLYNKFVETSDYDEEAEKDDELLSNLLDKLSEREIDMINMYYGRGYENSYTLEEIGEKYGLTKERARQIIEKAFTKIRSEAILIDSRFLSR